MINIKPQVKQALESNQALISLLGGFRIYQIMAPNADEYPRITFFEMTSFDTEFADDKSIGSEIHLQVDVWSKGNTSDISIEVDKTMKSLGFQRTQGMDLFEGNIKVFHKALRYTITVEEVS